MKCVAALALLLVGAYAQPVRTRSDRDACWLEQAGQPAA